MRGTRQVIRYAVVGSGRIAQAAVLPAFANARRHSQLVAIVSDDRAVGGGRSAGDHSTARGAELAIAAPTHRASGREPTEVDQGEAREPRLSATIRRRSDDRGRRP